MKSLRQTIRKILLENQQYYGKLAELITSGAAENINQAIELAETLEYVTNVSYTQNPYWNVVTKENMTEHRWEFDANQAFSDAIKHKRDTHPDLNQYFGARFDRPQSGHTIIRQIQ